MTQLYLLRKMRWRLWFSSIFPHWTWLHRKLYTDFGLCYLALKLKPIDYEPNPYTGTIDTLKSVASLYGGYLDGGFWWLSGYIKPRLQTVRAAIKKLTHPFKLGPLQKAWIKSLREHPERQTTKKLGIKYDDGTYKACCLGEGCLIANACEWKVTVLCNKDVNWRTGTLTKYSADMLGLRTIWGDPLDNEKFQNCVEMNDHPTRPKTWPEIADILEKYPEQYFIKAV